MLLNQVGHYNDLSPKLREELENKVRGFGKSVRYKFNISHSNPAPMGEFDKIIYPNIYTLDPTIFSINDPYEDRKDKQKSKRIAIVDGIDSKGVPDKFRKIRVEGKFHGIYKLDVEENNEHFNYAMFLELHPKLTNGKFSDKTKQQVFSRVDEAAHATEQRSVRTTKFKALKIAQEMSDKEIVDFADAMQWDSTEDKELLRNKVEDLADTNPEFFNDLVSGKNIEYQAVVKQALDRSIISFDIAEYKFAWVGNKQPITVLSPAGGKNEVEKLAEWLQVGGKKSEEIYKKIRGLLEERVPV